MLSDEKFKEYETRKGALKYLLSYVSTQVAKYQKLSDEDQALLTSIQTMMGPFISLTYENADTLSKVPTNKAKRGSVAKLRSSVKIRV